MKTAVIIPVYNQSDYLRGALDSLRAQTCPDWTAVIIDDGSTDSSPGILKSYGLPVTRIENRGVAEARNRGLERALAMSEVDSVQFFDPDDVLAPDCIAKARAAAQAHPGTIVEWGFEMNGRAHPAVPGRPGPNLWNKLYPRALVADVRFVSGANWAEDVAFNAEVRARHHPAFTTLSETLYRYTVKPDSLVHQPLTESEYRRRRATIDHVDALDRREAKDLRHQLAKTLRRVGLDMKISIIIPVYNVEKYLGRCYDSLVAAAREAGCRIEIISVNDGSSDHSLDVMTDYARRYADDPAVVFVNLTQPNSGTGAARNRGLAQVTGDWVMFVDSDDFLPPGSLRAFLRTALESGADVVASETFVRDRDYKVRGAGCEVHWKMVPGTAIRGRRHMEFSVWNKLYRASLVKDRRFETTNFEDFAFTIEVFSDIRAFALIKEPLYVYCVMNEGSSCTRSPFTEKKMKGGFAVIRRAIRHAAGGPSARFAFLQASAGVAMMINKIWKSRDAALQRMLMAGLREFFREYPDMPRDFPLKSRLRLWLMNRRYPAAK